MTNQEVRDYLIKYFPGFQEQWEKSDFLHQDGDFTHHGLLSEFSHYFRDNVEQFDTQQLQKFFGDIENWIIPEETDVASDSEKLSNATCTCFLENIAKEGITKKIKPYMGPKSLSYYQQRDEY